MSGHSQLLPNRSSIEAQTTEYNLGGTAEGLLSVCRIMNVIAITTVSVSKDLSGQQGHSSQQVRDLSKSEVWGHDASCSCLIGPDGDLRADSGLWFLIRGVTNLGIVDASAFPGSSLLFQSK